MKDISIAFCDDVKEFISDQIKPLLSKNDCFLQLGCHDASLVYELAPAVGSGGRVIGLESREAVIYEAFRQHIDKSDQLGFDNVLLFHNSGKELRTDLYRQSSIVKRQVIDNISALQSLQASSEQYFDANPVIDDRSIDTLLITEYLSDFSQASLLDLASEIARVLKPNGQCAILLPASKTRSSRLSLRHFTERLAILGVSVQNTVEHWVKSKCCTENHYLMLHLNFNPLPHKKTDYFNEQIDLLLVQDLATTDCPTPSVGCC